MKPRCNPKSLLFPTSQATILERSADFCCAHTNFAARPRLHRYPWLVPTVALRSQTALQYEDEPRALLFPNSDFPACGAFEQPDDTPRGRRHKNSFPCGNAGARLIILLRNDRVED